VKPSRRFTRGRALAALVGILTATVTAGCGGAGAGATAAPAEAPRTSASIAALHARKCGACHTPPEPGSRTRPHLEQAFLRHRRRVHLADEQWRALVDYLARPEVAR
jgi:hypothetical protein